MQETFYFPTVSRAAVEPTKPLFRRQFLLRIKRPLCEAENKVRQLPRPILHGAVTALSHTPSFCGAQLNTVTAFVTFQLHLTSFTLPSTWRDGKMVALWRELKNKMRVAPLCLILTWQRAVCHRQNPELSTAESNMHNSCSPLHSAWHQNAEENIWTSSQRM